MTDMSCYLSGKEQESSSIAGTIRVLLPVNENIGVMPEPDSPVRNTDSSLAGLSTGLHATVGQNRHMNGKLAGMTSSIRVVNSQISTTCMTFGNTGENIRQLARPMQAIPYVDHPHTDTDTN